MRILEREIRSAMPAAATAPAPKALVAEVVRLSDPHAIRWSDAVVPGGRKDVAREWIAARLAGRGGDGEDWEKLIREIGRPADDGLAANLPPGGPMRYPVPVRQRAITEAAEAHFRDEPPLI